MKNGKNIIAVTGTRGIPSILGGIETHCEELYPLLYKTGKFDITVIRRSEYVNDNLTEYKGVKLYDIKSPKIKSLEAIIHTFRAIIAAKFRIKADIIHIHAIGPAIMVPFAKLLGLKVVFTHHGFDYDREKWGKLAKFALRTGERFAVRYADEVIVISDVIKDVLKKKYNRSNTKLIYNGVPIASDVSLADYMEKLGIKKDSYILALGRFVPEKNFHHLIKAYSEMQDENLRLEIAGDSNIEDEYSKELKNIARQNNVVLPGFIKGDKLATLLNNASLFVLPSSHEGLPISLLEAMSYSLPVLASDIKPNVEVGLSANCYFRLGDIEDMKNKIKYNLSSEPHKVNYNMENYNWGGIAEKVADIYKSLLTRIT